MLAVVTLFDQGTSLTDIMFVFSMLFTSNDVMQKLRYKPWIISGICLSVISILCIYPIWVEKGTANGNYLFFQQFALWAFLSVFIVEFSSSALQHLRSEKNPC